MRSRIAAISLLTALLLAPTGLAAADAPAVRQRLVGLPGFPEPHTPGSEDPREIAPTPRLVELLGPGPDLNRVHYVRTAAVNPAGRVAGARARVVLILIPGFSVGARTLDPLAKDLVRRVGGALEVWAVERRPNQLEDRLGAEHALARLAAGRADALVEGVRFYFPDEDRPPVGDFPGPGDIDVDANGSLDPALELEDRLGVERTARLLEDDDLRFLAHWGVDTYVRDWRLLVERARVRVGPRGLVLLGGHSQGTTWATLFAAYDFDPGEEVHPGYGMIDGLLLLEGNGVQRDGGFGFFELPAPPPDLAAYRERVAALATPGGPGVFLGELTLAGVSLFSVPALGAAVELGAMAAVLRPVEPAILRRTPVLRSGLLAAVFGSDATNRALFGFLLDDDFQPFAPYRASIGFSDDGPNVRISLTLPGFETLLDAFYLAGPAFGSGPRNWQEFRDPTLPTCPPRDVAAPGCAILDNGPPSDPDDPTLVPRPNGVEREVTDLTVLAQTQFGAQNGIEWYFSSGRSDLDLSFGNDSRRLGDERLLAVTQNAAVDVPVLAIGGSNGLTPEPRSYAPYLESIATAPADREVVILPGYAHADVVMAEDNEAVPVICRWIERLRTRRGRRMASGPDAGADGIGSKSAACADGLEPAR